MQQHRKSLIKNARTCLFFFTSTHLVYRSLGCWKDRSNRAISTLERQSSLLDGDYVTRTDPIQKCLNATLALGYDVFAVQNGGWCASDATARNTFQKYGISTACSHDGEGGPWANQVYEITYGNNCFIHWMSKCNFNYKIIGNH